MLTFFLKKYYTIIRVRGLHWHYIFIDYWQVLSMNYMGSKRRVAKYILPIILRGRFEDQVFIDLFVGGANVIDGVRGERVGIDNNVYLISLLNGLSNGWVPPKELPEDRYVDIKRNSSRYDPKLVGFAGICCSFGGKWFGGYRRDSIGKRDYILEAHNNCIKQAPRLRGAGFICCDYKDFIPPKHSIIYCDPPYKGVTRYAGGFDHEEFYAHCRMLSAIGHSVFISEYEMPNDFRCIWERDQTTTVSTGKYKRSTERLFTL